MDAEEQVAFSMYIFDVAIISNYVYWESRYVGLKWTREWKRLRIIGSRCG